MVLEMEFEPVDQTANKSDQNGTVETEQDAALDDHEEIEEDEEASGPPRAVDPDGSEGEIPSDLQLCQEVPDTRARMLNQVSRLNAYA